ncbi:MAG: hypothetical protein P1V51_17670 [Deltaproteobacteria bacterium]|nr:hypothetical protein [Deltaproteobacteria bacterium]
MIRSTRRFSTLPAAFGVLALVAISNLACEQVDSEDVLTSGVYANITAEADGDGSTTVSTSLRVGGALSNTFLELGAEESVTATSGGETKTLARRNVLGAISYVGTFTGDETDKAFTVAWNRGEGYESAPNTTLSLPAGFEITAPAAGATFSRANDDIVLTWDSSGTTDDMLWEIVTSTCAREMKSNTITGDPGTLTIAAGTLTNIDGHEGETCDTTLVLLRRRLGNLDPAYGEGGWVVGRHVRTVTFSSAP